MADMDKRCYSVAEGSFQSGNGSTFIYPGQIPGEKIESTSLIVICGEMVAKLATNDDKKIYSTGIVPII